MRFGGGLFSNIYSREVSSHITCEPQTFEPLFFKKNSIWGQETCIKVMTGSNPNLENFPTQYAGGLTLKWVGSSKSSGVVETKTASEIAHIHNCQIAIFFPNMLYYLDEISKSTYNLGLRKEMQYMGEYLPGAR